MQSLRPAGLPPQNSQRRAMKRIISIGVENALWLAGERRSSRIATPRIAAISALTLAGSHLPWPGLAPWPRSFSYPLESSDRQVVVIH
jgi:hypothetical protein